MTSTAHYTEAERAQAKQILEDVMNDGQPRTVKELTHHCVVRGLSVTSGFIWKVIESSPEISESEWKTSMKHYVWRPQNVC